MVKDLDNQQHLQAEDTICALATPAGGAIGIIRISGKDAIQIADKVFVTSKHKKLHDAKSHTILYGRIVDGQQETIDDVLVSVFRSPHSYTGEDSVEISCHGSRYIIKTILEMLIKEGCRQAAPGEYTQRAFFNGKLDLSQAEAVADLIASTNRATHHAAMSQLKGNFSNELATLRNELLKMTSLIELELDFSDHEDLEFANRDELLALAHKIKNRITTLAHSFETGNAIKQGVPVAIIGKTNVGKSTLLNQLLEEDKAIVSNIHGTTRDVIEDTTEINGITFRFIDTAGIRKTTDEIENLGIERTYQKIEEAKIVLWLMDEAPTKQEVDALLKRINDKSLICIQNKMDISPTPTLSVFENIINQKSNERNAKKRFSLQLSAKLGTNMDLLRSTLCQVAEVPEVTENDVIVTSTRHYNALLRSEESISRVIEGLDLELSGDLLSEDLRLCLEHLAEITGGLITTHEVLNNIFQHFCIGK